MPEKKDYYGILGIGKDASKEDIKKAYKRLAKEYHPDKYSDADKKKWAEEKFKEINEAASILGDDTKRQQYDTYGTAEPMDFSGFDFRDFGGFGGGNFSDFDFGDIFDMFFGGGGFGFSGQRTRRRSYDGENLRFDITVTLNEAADGAEKTILLPRLEACEKCNGTGAKDSSDMMTCDACRGSGRRIEQRRTAFGIFQTQTTCPKCSGQGTIIKEPCEFCDGEGRVSRSSKIKIRIPAGVEEGMRLRIPGEGEAGAKGGSPGDLYVVVHIEPHKLFVRQGTEIFIEVPISFSQAALGDTIDVPTLDGNSRIKIPPGTQSHTIFQIKGKGMPSVRGYGKGSENVKVIVQVPDSLSKKQRQLLEEFAVESGESPSKSFFDKFRI